jgi:multicomponent Na+:H+ antiporter subunit D
MNNLLANLPALQILVPLLGAPFLMLVCPRKNSWALTQIITLFTFLISFTMISIIIKDGPIIYSFGGWEAPIGIEYRIDLFSSLILCLVTGVTLVTTLYSKRTLQVEIPEIKHPTFYGIFLLCYTGLIGIIITNDVFNAYVFLEITSLASYALIAMSGNKRSKIASFNYLIYGTIGATFFLLGIGMLYVKTGTLNMTDLAARLLVISHTTTVKAGAAFIIVGLLLKIALFPMHLWVPNVYSSSPNFIATFFSAVTSKVNVYLLIRFMFSIFNLDEVFGSAVVNYFLIAFASFSIIIGATAATYQTDLKRLLAFSSISQIGYIILAAAIGSSEAFAAAIIFIIYHAVAKAALFMIAGTIQLQAGTTDLLKLTGAGIRMPFLGAALTINLASLVGIPLTAGFIGKWSLLKAVIIYNKLLLAVIIVGSVLAFFYTSKIVEIMYFRDKGGRTVEGFKEPPYSMQLPIWILTVTNIYLGLCGYYWQLAKSVTESVLR